MSAAKTRQSAGRWLIIYTLFAAPCAFAEIIFLEGGKAVSIDPSYAYAHPALRSLVFASPELRQLSILPPPPVFLASPPLLWRAPAAYPAYPPYPPANYIGGANSPLRPSNRDITTYNLQRAHAFSQELFYRDTVLSLGVGSASPLFIWSNGSMPYYPPPAANGGFNQPSRPSNRDATTYNLERAHRFSTDAYKKP